MSQPTVMYQPRPIAKPLTAAMSGLSVSDKPNMFLSLVYSRPSTLPPSLAKPSAWAFMSRPAQKAWPVPVRIPTQALSSALKRRNASTSSSLIGGDIALSRSGRFSRITAM